MRMLWLIFMGPLFFITDAADYHQSDYTVKFERVEAPDYNRSYLANVTCGLVYYNRTFRAVNASGYLIKDLSMNMKATLQLYKFLSNEYRFFPLTINVNACKELERDTYGIRESLQQTLNFDLRCPVKQGIKKLSYGKINYSHFPPYIPGGQYKATLKIFEYSNFLFEAHIYVKIEEVLKKWKN